MSANLRAYTIFESPLDYPGLFVVREFIIGAGQARPGVVIGTAATLQEARQLVPMQADAMFGRDPEEDGPTIVETWM